MRVSQDNEGYYRADQLFQEVELVLEATCTACSGQPLSQGTTAMMMQRRDFLQGMVAGLTGTLLGSTAAVVYALARANLSSNSDRLGDQQPERLARVGIHKSWFVNPGVCRSADRLFLYSRSPAPLPG